MDKAEYPKIKQALTRLAYLLNQTTRHELSEAVVDTLAFYQNDKAQFLSESAKILETICQHKSILPRQTYLLAIATLEQVKHKRP